VLGLRCYLTSKHKRPKAAGVIAADVNWNHAFECSGRWIEGADKAVRKAEIAN
jgi:hypothetical protein